jgi:hypothetical protein
LRFGGHRPPRTELINADFIGAAWHRLHHITRAGCIAANIAKLLWARSWGVICTRIVRGRVCSGSPQ